MILLNFSHPLDEKQLEVAKQIAGSSFKKVLDISTHFNHQESFPDQLNRLVLQIPLNSKEWQTEKILVIPPSLSIISCMLLPELHGRMGYFPAMVRIKPISGSIPPSYEPAEIINLQEIRDKARSLR